MGVEDAGAFGQGHGEFGGVADFGVQASDQRRLQVGRNEVGGTESMPFSLRASARSGWVDFRSRLWPSSRTVKAMARRTVIASGLDESMIGGTGTRARLRASVTMRAGSGTRSSRGEADDAVDEDLVTVVERHADFGERAADGLRLGPPGDDAAGDLHDDGRGAGDEELLVAPFVGLVDDAVRGFEAEAGAPHDCDVGLLTA